MKMKRSYSMDINSPTIRKLIFDGIVSAWDNMSADRQKRILMNIINLLIMLQI